MFLRNTPEGRALDQLDLDATIERAIIMPYADTPSQLPPLEKPLPWDEARLDALTLRTGYRRFAEIAGFSPVEPPEWLVRRGSSSPLQDKIRISAAPLILSASERAIIETGTVQMGRALSRLFEDLVLGTAEAAGPKGIVPAALIERIMSRTRYKSLSALRRLWRGHSREEISFSFGPDLMRGPNGSWSVSEVNIGALGGRGDNAAIHRWYSEQLGPALSENLREAGFELAPAGWTELTRRFAEARGAGRQIIASAPVDKKKGEADREDERIARQLEGVADSFANPREVIRGFQGRARPVLFLDDGFGGASLDRLFSVHHAALLNAPGAASLLDNKLLLEYLPELVRFYLLEEPILKVIPSYNLNLRESEAPPHYVDFLPAFPEGGRAVPPMPRLAGWVMKAPTLCAGQGVWLIDEQNEVGAKVLLQVLAQLDKFGESGFEDPIFVFQPFLHASLLGSGHPDVRPIAQVISADQNVFVDPVPWGRIRHEAAATAESLADTDDLFDVIREGRKTNVSLGAEELPVFVAC